MNLEEIKEKADSFFEFPTENKDHVTTTSAILFARHILEFADCSANCHQFYDSINELQTLVANRCAEICENQNQSDDRQLCADLIRKEFNIS